MVEVRNYTQSICLPNIAIFLSPIEAWIVEKERQKEQRNKGLSPVCVTVTHP